MKDIRENSIKKIISTDIFFNSCNTETKKIIDIIDNLNIKENYEYPKDIIIHNIISNIFNKIEITNEYCKIIIHIIEQLLNIKLPINNTLPANTILTQNIKYTLRFILKKIIYFDNLEKSECLEKIKDDIDNIIKKVDKKNNNEKRNNKKTTTNKKTIFNYGKSLYDSTKSFLTGKKKISTNSNTSTLKNRKPLISNPLWNPVKSFKSLISKKKENNKEENKIFNNKIISNSLTNKNTEDNNESKKKHIIKI